MFAGSVILTPQIGGMTLGSPSIENFYVGADIRLDMGRDEIIDLLAKKCEESGRAAATKWADTVQWEPQ